MAGRENKFHLANTGGVFIAQYQKYDSRVDFVNSHVGVKLYN